MTLLLTHQVAARLGVCRKTVQRWARKGVLRFSRVGRSYLFDPADVERLRRWVERNHLERITTRRSQAHPGCIGSTEAARRVGVSVRTVHAWANAGKVPVFRDGRGHRWFDAAAIEALTCGEPATAPVVPVVELHRDQPAVRRGFDLTDTNEL